MRRIMHSVISLILSVSILISASALAPQAAESSLYSGESFSPDCVNANSYIRYATVERNYLRAVPNGYMRLYGGDDGKQLIEYYDKSFRFVSNRVIECGLPMFGGFYESDKYYFVVTGQTNHEENDKKEVIRISRFDKDWNPKGYDSLYGANTSNPFKGGRCAFAEYGSYLVIRSAHELYAINGTVHQSNITIEINMDTMKIAHEFTGTSNIKGAGYLSHSLNQYVATDSDGTVVCLDHGDAYPRSATLGRFLSKANNLIIYNDNYITFEYTELFEYYGTHGDNYTSAILGGLECSDSAYITVGSIAGQNGSYRTNRAYNAYITVTDKSVSDLSTAKTKVIYLSSFKESDNRCSYSPRLVKINNDRFLVMWNEFPAEEYATGMPRDFDDSYKMKYVFINGKGELMTDIMTAPESSYAYVTDCEPIVNGSDIMWYVSDGKGIFSIVSLSMSGKLTVHKNVIPDSIFVYPIDLSSVRVAFRSFEAIPDTVTITADNFDQYFVVTYNGKDLVMGRDFTLADDDPRNVGEAISARYEDGYLRFIRFEFNTVTGRSFFPSEYSYNWSVNFYDHFLYDIARERGGVRLSAKVYRGVGYKIYRSSDGRYGEYTLVGTVNTRGTGEFFDYTARRTQEYYYAIMEYTFDKNGNEILSEPSYALSVPAEADDSPSGGAVLLGDSDKDGEVTIIDATNIQRWLAALVYDEDINRFAADADLDGEVSILDATAIQRWLADFPSKYPIGEMVEPDQTEDEAGSNDPSHGALIL